MWDASGHSATWAAYRAQRPARYRADLRLGELARLWAAAAAPGWNAAYRVTLASAMFRAMMGDMLVQDISRESLLDFRDRLKGVPKRLLRAEMRTPREERYGQWIREGIGTRIGLAPATIATRAKIIRTLVGFAHAERWIVRDDLHDMRLSSRPVTLRRSFTKDKMRALFALPLFTRPWLAPTRPMRVSEATIRWIFQIALMTGARLEEIGQLQAGDIREREGGTFIQISEQGIAGEDTAKRLKNLSSRRLVPVHQRLKDLGFLRIERERAVAGDPWLFPDLAANKWGVRTHRAGCRCGKIIDKLTRDPALVLHSLRHSFKDRGREAGIEDSINDQLTGHAPRTIGRAYGDGVDGAALVEAIARLDFECIEWEPLLRAVSSH